MEPYEPAHRLPTIRDETLASAEEYFRKNGLPACALGYDQKYPVRVSMITVLLVVVSAVVYVGVIFFATEYAFYLGLLPLLLLCPQALGYYLSRRLPTEFGRGRLFGQRQARRRQVLYCIVLGCCVSLAGALLLFANGLVRTVGWWVDGAVLGVILVSSMGGVVSLALHLLHRLIAGFVPSLAIAAREMPLLFPSLLIVFVTDDAWRLFGLLEGWRYFVVLALLSIVAFVALQVRSRTERVSLLAVVSGAGRKAVDDAANDSPLKELRCDGLQPYRSGPLPRAVQRNVHVMLGAVAVLRVALVGLATAGALVIFGVCVVDAGATSLLLEVPDGDVAPIVDIELFGTTVIITEPLVRLAGVLGALACVYFAIAVPSGRPHRRGESLTFMSDELDRTEATLIVYSLYLGAHLQKLDQAKEVAARPNEDVEGDRDSPVRSSRHSRPDSNVTLTSLRSPTNDAPGVTRRRSPRRRAGADGAGG